MIFILILNVLSFYFAKTFGAFLKKRNIVLPSDKYVIGAALILLCLFFSLIGLNCLLHTYLVGKYSDVIFYVCSFLLLDVLIIGIKPVGMNKTTSIVLSSYVVLRHAAGLILFGTMLLFICVFWTVVLPIRYDVVMHRIIDRSGDINVFDNYYVVFSIPFHQRMNQVAIYKRHLFLFKTLETEHELKQGFVLSEGDDDSKKYKYSRRWDDTMFIGCYKLFYEERIEVKDVHTYTTSRVVVYPMDMPAMAIAKRQAGMLIVREHGKYCFSEGPVEQDDILFARPDVVSGNGTDRPFPGTLRGNYAPFFYCADE